MVADGQDQWANAGYFFESVDPEGFQNSGAGLIPGFAIT
jgi:hypothetical protein